MYYVVGFLFIVCFSNNVLIFLSVSSHAMVLASRRGEIHRSDDSHVRRSCPSGTIEKKENIEREIIKGSYEVVKGER